MEYHNIIPIAKKIASSIHDVVVDCVLQLITHGTIIVKIQEVKVVVVAVDITIR